MKPMLATWCLAAVLAGGAASGATSPGLDIRIIGLRSAKGVLRICLTADRVHFPDCTADPKARQLNLPASRHDIHVDGVPPGPLAIAIFHDENGNGRLDKFAGIPREGIGFSNNPALRFGPPRFDEARLTVGSGGNATTIRMRYFL